MGIWGTTNPKKPKKRPWAHGVERRRQIELALREKEQKLFVKPMRSSHVWMRQQNAIDGPKKGRGHAWVRVEIRLFEGGTVELLQRAPTLRKLITLQECSAEARNFEARSDIDNKVQLMTYTCRYEELRYNDTRLHTALLRPSSALTKKSSPEAEFVFMPRTSDAVIEVDQYGAGRDGGMEEIVLRAETVTEKTDWLQSILPYLFKESTKAPRTFDDDISVVSSMHEGDQIASGPMVRRRAKPKPKGGGVAGFFGVCRWPLDDRLCL